MKKNNFFKITLLAFSILSIAGCSNVEPAKNTEEFVYQDETIDAHGMMIQRLSSGVDQNDHPYQTFSYTLVPSSTSLIRMDCSLTFADSRQNGSNYLTYAIDESNKTVTITCLQAFDSRATFTLMSHYNHNIYANVIVRYMPKRTVEGLTSDLGYETYGTTLWWSSFDSYISQYYKVNPAQFYNSSRNVTVYVSTNSEGESSSWNLQSYSFNSVATSQILTASEYSTYDNTYSTSTEKAKATAIMNSFLNSSSICANHELNGDDFYDLWDNNISSSDKEVVFNAIISELSEPGNKYYLMNWFNASSQIKHDAIYDYYSNIHNPQGLDVYWIEMVSWAYNFDFSDFIQTHGDFNTGYLTFTWDLASVSGLDSRFVGLTVANSDNSFSGSAQMDWSNIEIIRHIPIDQFPSSVTSEVTYVDF